MKNRLSQTLKIQRFAEGGLEKSGEGGIIPSPISQPPALSRLTQQLLQWLRLACFLLFLVGFGYFALIRNRHSTLIAHSPFQKETLMLASSLAGPVSARRKRRKRSRDTPDSDHADMRAASYARYSSNNQREESISDQERKCDELAGKNGHRILPDLRFSDEAISGTKLKRDGLDALLMAAEAGEFDVLYVDCLSRLARESVITLPILKRLVHVYNIRFISVSEGIDSDRDGWELIATILSVMHERFIKDLSANVFRGQEGTVLNHFSVGDWCFGYGSEPIPGSETTRKGRNAKPRMRYIVDPETSTWVVRIFHWFVYEKQSIRWIVRQLNERGAPKDHRSSSPEWHHELVVKLLAREKYIGIWPWGGDAERP